MGYVSDKFARVVRIIVSDRGAVGDRVIAALREVRHCVAGDFPTPQAFEAFRRLRDEVAGNRPTEPDPISLAVRDMTRCRLDAIENRLMDIAEMTVPPARRSGQFA